MSLKYPNIVVKYYQKYKESIYKIATKVRKMYYSIPIEIDDIVSHLLYKLNTIEVQTEFYKSKQTIEQFIFSRIKYYMMSYCNLYSKNKSHQILNNYVYDDNNETFKCELDYYFNSNNFFYFLSDYEFELIYEIYFSKKHKKDIAKKHNFSLYILNAKEKEILRKIKKHYSNI